MKRDKGREWEREKKYTKKIFKREDKARKGEKWKTIREERVREKKDTKKIFKREREQREKEHKER